MKIFDSLDRYLNEKEYRITFFNNKLNVNNYDEILDFSSDLIKIRHKKGVTKIKGRGLCVSKMLASEVLIEGEIISIDLT